MPEQETKETTATDHFRNALGWLDNARDEIVDAMKSADKEQRAKFLNLGPESMNAINEVIAILRDAMEMPQEVPDKEDEWEDD